MTVISCAFVESRHMRVVYEDGVAAIVSEPDASSFACLSSAQAFSRPGQLQVRQSGRELGFEIVDHPTG